MLLHRPSNGRDGNKTSIMLDTYKITVLKEILHAECGGQIYITVTYQQWDMFVFVKCCSWPLELHKMLFHVLFPHSTSSTPCFITKKCFCLINRNTIHSYSRCWVFDRVLFFNHKIFRAALDALIYSIGVTVNNVRVK